ncbi:helix-turn-helix domain-containing protein [Curtobacterium sp. MCPF17_002]|uniref:TetR/AcrR family transcriptional regulator n=1 Tax=Curtobacterium sp. MCPF17_002 TaxID=2175645 RepID=UPI000DA8614E|nr:TetR/AcrR family transcriptional regulator [Curtobacterium sp. MCPF17_002]WIB76259.1 helix-turn-helix domain-containing protein [Curtobacterium sp. MCPF17_002]
MPALRADARRNEQAVLDAARALFEQAESPSDVSMDRIAAAAGVGKGTLFRRFGDRDGLIRALVAERTGPLLAAIQSGSPPLGPGGPAAERLLAVLEAVIDAKIDTVALSLAHESGTASPYTAPGYEATHAVVSAALRDLNVDGDPDIAAHLVLAATRADLIAVLVRTEQRTRAEIVDAVVRHASALFGRTPRGT